MTPEKCNYIIFSKNLKTAKAENLTLKFFGKPIEQLEKTNTTFLGSKSLISKYLFQAEVHNNPIIIELLADHAEFKEELNKSKRKVSKSLLAYIDNKHVAKIGSLII